MLRNILLALLVLLITGTAPAAGVNTMTAEQAYDSLRQTGELSDATITGPFDFDQLDTPSSGQPFPGIYRIRDVEFEGPISVGSKLRTGVRIETSHFKGTVRLQQCKLQTFTVSKSRWAGDLIVEDCVFNGFSRFDGNDFRGDVRFHLARFLRRPSFADSFFHGRTEFLKCEFGIHAPASMATSYSDVVFEGPALFNNSVFHTKAKFQSAVFGHDASFINVRMDGGAAFRNVHFKGDAEFRFCRISSADFGDQENLTLFAKRADFRGCKIETGVFDYVDFLGETRFVNSQFGAGGATFRHAHFGNKIADFDGLSSSGPLVLANAHIPSLHFRWREIRGAVLAADPDAKVLATLHARLESLGEADGALDASYHLSRSKFAETTAESLPSPTRNPAEFLDIFSRRLVAYGEWLVWGWPSGYGTKLGRVLLLALACWLIGALPAATTPGVLARISYDPGTNADNKTEKTSRIYDPLVPEDLAREPRFPKAFPERLTLALGFTFRVLFKVGPEEVRYVVTRTLPARRSLWRIYFASLWYLGSGLLLLMTLTLANTSPIIHKLIGELLT